MVLAGRNYVALLVVTALATGACVTWRPYGASSGLESGQPLPNRLRATRQDSTRIALTAPFLRADTLYGRVHGDTVAVPIREIARLEGERFSLTRTIGAVLGVPLAAFGITYIVVCGEGQCQPKY